MNAAPRAIAVRHPGADRRVASADYSVESFAPQAIPADDRSLAHGLLMVA
jgi:hypothetical protein